jgi:hypothetical protein
LRWLNYQLKNAGSSRVATKVTKDLSDSDILTTVLKQIEPKCFMLAPLRQTDLWQGADGMLAEADKIDCRNLVGAKEIVQEQVWLNFAFTANFFNTRLHFRTAFLPGLICIHPRGRSRWNGQFRSTE